MAQESRLAIVIDSRTAEQRANDLKTVLEQLEKSGSSATITLADLGDGSKKMGDQAKGAAQSIGEMATAIGSVVSVSKLWGQIQKSTLDAGRYDQLGIIMEVVGRNAGYSSGELHGLQKELEATGISMTQSRQVIASMIQANLDLSEATKLARLAQDAATIGNISSSAALEKLVYGVQTAQTEVLRGIGITVNFEQAYKGLAEEIGVTTASLSEQEKMQARVNAVMAQGPAIAGSYEASMESANKQLGSMERHADNLSVKMGDIYQPAFAFAIEKMTDGLKFAGENAKVLSVGLAGVTAATAVATTGILALRAGAVALNVALNAMRSHPVIMALSLVAGAAGAVALAFSDTGSKARAASGDIDAMTESIERLTAAQAAQANKSLIPQLEEQEENLRKFNAQIEYLQIQISTYPRSSMIKEWSDDLIDAKGNADTASKKIAEIRERMSQLQSKATQASSAIGNLIPSKGMEKWDEYIKKLTDARDMIGMNARQLGEFQAEQQGANSIQAKMAGIVSAESDEFRNLQSAIQDKKKDAAAAAIENIKNLDLERQRVALLAQQMASVMAAARQFAAGNISADVQAGVYASINEAYAKLAGDLAVSDETQKIIERIQQNTVPTSGGGGGGGSKSNPGADYIKDMRERIVLLGKETEHEQLLAKITAGSIQFRSAGERALAEEAAKAFDATKRQIEVEEVLRDLRQEQSITQMQFMRELESFGQGNNVRELNAELAKVEDRYRSIIDARRNSPLGLSDEELGLIRESLQAELDMVREFHDQKLALQGDWRLGAMEGLKGYVEEVANVYDSMSNMVGNAFKGMEDALTEFVTTGKMDFKSLADSIIKDMIRIAIQQSITGPLAGMIGGLFGGEAAAAPAGVTPGVDWLWSSGGYTGDGGKYDPAGIVHKGEGVLNQDEIRALGGESGFNALRRAIRTGHAIGGMGGRPSLPPSGSNGPTGVQVNIINQTSTPVKATTRTTMDDMGRQMVTVMIQDMQNNGPYIQGLKQLMGA